MRILKRTKGLIFYALLLMGLNSFSQSINLKSLKWKNRVVLIVTNNTNDSLYYKQLSEFIDNPKAFEERKLKVFDIQKNRAREITYTNGKTIIGSWFVNDALYKKYSSRKTNFKTLLIGLDGGIKKIMKQKVFTKELLLTLIDGMPMRRSEVRKN
ncbi:DUF4174 domain-containing protein [uncultured Tenacibaculum sp.]|uniref:DUF4174 domain-containing protein n=1 Tax=uncultured Tenacibaculum sp. TaxID=174713 RepID=UPI00263343E5|nr:DUF4174 domain-containing protein [uncultured Tenacibaculum sp.]